MKMIFWSLIFYLCLFTSLYTISVLADVLGVVLFDINISYTLRILLSIRCLYMYIECFSENVIVHEWGFLRWGLRGEYTPTWIKSRFYMADGKWLPNRYMKTHLWFCEKQISLKT